MATDFTLVLTNSAAATYTFTYTPAVSFQHNNLYNQSTEPPTISGVQEVWDITEATFIDPVSETLATAYLTFLAFIATKVTPVVKVELKKNGSTIHTMSTTSHTKFMVSNVRMVDSPGRHANHLICSFQVTGVRGLPIASGDGSAQAVTKLEQKLTFTYSRGGFLTKTLSGVIRTNSTGSEAAARLIGSIDLDGMGAAFTYETNGPEGVDVEVLSHPADNASSFRCVVVEQGLDYPSTDVYVFLKTVKTHKTKFADYLETTIVCQAIDDATAEATAREEAPTNAEGEDFSLNYETHTFTITYLSKAFGGSGTVISKEYSFKYSGGDRPIVSQEVLYGDPIIGKGSKTPFVVEETFTILNRGSPEPAPVLGAFAESAEDIPAMTVSTRRTKLTLLPETDEYETVISRRYVFATEPAGVRASILAAFGSA